MSILVFLIFFISIGSLGKDNSIAVVTAIILDTAIITGTTNGLRIKTWQVLKFKIKSLMIEVQIVWCSEDVNNLNESPSNFGFLTLY